MTSVRRGPRGVTDSVRIGFGKHEAQILANLLRELVELLYDGMPPRTTSSPDDPLAELINSGGPTAAPEDPVLARLLPDAYSDDPTASAEFRRLTERAMRDTKAGDARHVLEVVETAIANDSEEIVVAGADFPRWLKTLNDLRLALGTRLEVTQDDQDFWLALPDDDPRRITYGVYDWLGYLQASLLAHRRP